MTKAALNVIDLYIQSDFCRGGNGENEDELWADRALVSAAPNLLQALEDASAYIGKCSYIDRAKWLAVRATIDDAINKAKGN